MAQMTGTEIVALARLRGNDPQAVVGNSDILTLLNEILLIWGMDVEVRQTTLSATSSGCTVAANASTVVLTDTTIEDILALHPADSSSLTYPLKVELDRKDPEYLWGMYNQLQNSSGTVPAANQWIMWGAERDTDNPDAWAIHVYPTLSSTGYANLRVTRRLSIASLSATPDISYRAGRVIARLLAYEIASLQKQNDSDWMERILRPIPRDILNKFYGQGRMAGATQGYIRDRGHVDK